MRIFISGIAGFLGSHMAGVLQSYGHEVIGVDNLIGGYEDNVPEGIEWWRDDCFDMEKMTKRMEGCDVVFHAACTAYEGLSVFSPFLITRNTYGITVSLATAAIRAGVKRFIHCSSMARYGEQPTVPFKEDMIPMPRDPYGLSKLAAEQALQQLCEIHGMEYVIAIPHNIIGPRQKYDDPFRNVASIMLNLSLQKRGHIIYGDGEQRRCFSYISDVTDCLTKLLTIQSGTIINIGPDEEFVSINELSILIRTLTNSNKVPQYLPDRPREVKFATCSSDKARFMLGYKTQVGLADGLRHMMEWIQLRGVRKFQYHLPLEILGKNIPRSWTDKLF